VASPYPVEYAPKVSSTASINLVINSSSIP
jgi:hypothetical protein